MKFLIGFFICFCFFTLNAPGQSVLTRDAIQTDYVEFGKGGGFSGTEKAYILTKDGNIYSIQNSMLENSPLDFIKKVNTCTVQKIFKYINKNNITEITYNQPGNTYTFINLFINHTKHPLAWGSSSSTPPQKVTNLSTRLNNLL